MEVSGECYGKPCTRVPLVLHYSQKCEGKQGHPPSVCLFFICVHRHFSHKAPDAQKLLNVDVTLSPKCFPSSISIPVAVVWFSNATKAGLATCWHCPCGEELNEAQYPITGSAFPWCPHFFPLYPPFGRVHKSGVQLWVGSDQRKVLCFLQDPFCWDAQSSVWVYTEPNLN